MDKNWAIFEDFHAIADESEVGIMALCHIPPKERTSVMVPLFAVQSPPGDLETLRERMHQDIDKLIDYVIQNRTNDDV